MLEARVTHIESDLKEVKTDLKSLLGRTAKIEGEVSRLPGWPGIVTMAGVTVTLILGGLSIATNVILRAISAG